MLFAVLDWGLGHAARSVPIIRSLSEAENVSIVLASNGRAAALLAKEFPDLPLETLPAYNVSYGRDNFLLDMLLQLPKIASAIAREFVATRKIVRKHAISHIISDSRFGCFHPKLPSAIISHQLQLQLPSHLAQFGANLSNKFFINNFKYVWIPDNEGKYSLSGALSDTKGIKGKIEYLGFISRFIRYEMPIERDVLVVLSGPEPQRSLFEQMIIAQASRLPQRFLIVQGRTEASAQQAVQINDKLHLIPFLTATELNKALCASRYVLARSGYTTLLDLAALGKKAILVPTPGQTEQEYLGASLQNKGAFVVQQQASFDLAAALERIEDTTGLVVPPQQNQLRSIINAFLDTHKKPF